MDRKRPSSREEEVEIQAPPPKRTAEAVRQPCIEATIRRPSNLMPPTQSADAALSRPPGSNQQLCSGKTSSFQQQAASRFNSRTLSQLHPSYIETAKARLGCAKEKCLRTFFDADKMAKALKGVQQVSQELVYAQQRDDQSRQEEIQRLRDELHVEKQLRQKREGEMAEMREELAEVREGNECLSESMQLLCAEMNSIAMRNDEVEGILMRYMAKQCRVAVQTDDPPPPAPPPHHQSQVISYELQLDDGIFLVQELPEQKP